MPISGLTIIGETINDSVPSTHKLFDAGDVAGLLELARMQDERGAAYIDVNVGPRSAEFMADMVRKIQGVTTKPLSIDTPDVEIARAGLEAYDLDRSGGRKPVLNSISPLRIKMFDLYSICPFRPILLVSEQMVDGQCGGCHTAEETLAAAKAMRAAAVGHGIANDDLIFDPGIAPIGSDSEGNLRRLVQAAALVHDDPDFAGVPGLPEGTGPYKVITDLAVLGFDERSKRMQVESLHPGVTFERVQENTGFELLKTSDVGQTEPPRQEELRILREAVDPYRYVIGR